MLSMKDLVFKEQLARKLVDWHVLWSQDLRVD